MDVRLLLPQGSDVGWVVPVSRSLYRPLLESGVRIFEWNGTMVHAKTAVADSRWARIGSTNLNLNSWMGNWELDVAIENEGLATTLETHFLEDLSRSTEIATVPQAATLRLRRPAGDPRFRQGRGSHGDRRGSDAGRGGQRQPVAGEFRSDCPCSSSAARSSPPPSCCS